MATTVKITISGGFHGSSPVNVIIPSTDFQALEAGFIGLAGALSVSQRRRLDRHFCGVEGCTCGGVTRATWSKFNR